MAYVLEILGLNLKKKKKNLPQSKKVERHWYTTDSLEKKVKYTTKALGVKFYDSAGQA